MSILTLLGVTTLMAILGGIVCGVSILAVSGAYDWNLNDILMTVQTKGFAVLVGVALIAILAICFAYNKPDPDQLG